MPLPFVIPGIIAVIGTTLAVSFWSEIVDWFKEVFSQVKRLFLNIVHATAAFVKKAANAIAKVMHRLYYKEDNKWIEETTTREISESELPDSIKKKLRVKETEVTEELEAMGLEV